MNNRGIVVLAQNSLDYNHRVFSKPILQAEYEGIHVDIWYKELTHIKGQHVFYKNTVYKVIETALSGTDFTDIKKEVLVKNVKLHSDKNITLEFNRAKKNDVVLSDNNLYLVLEEDDASYYDLTPIYADLHVDIWYDDLLHLKGQHVWFNDSVYRLEKNISKGSALDETNSTLIAENVKLYDDKNQFLTFYQPKAGDTILSFNKLYEVEPIVFFDYVKQACLLAITLKKHNAHEKISIITDDEIPVEHQELFDQIIPIPFGDESVNSLWKIENRWKIYHCTPYDETLVLDTDMLILQDISLWWNFFSKYDLYFTSNILDYRGNVVVDDFYRRTFTKNNLPNVYSGMHYFKKSLLAEEFYNLLEVICKDWKKFYEEFLPHETPYSLSIDVAAALAVKILGIEHEVTNKRNEDVTFVHMKSKIQGWNKVYNSWQESIMNYVDSSLQVYVGNYLQSRVFHYTEKDFLTNKNLATLLGEYNV